MGVWLGIGVVAVAFALALVDGDSGLRTWWALRADLRAAQLRIERLKGEVADLESEGGGLAGAGEPFALERAIRDRLGYARAGETLVRLDPPAPPGDASPRIP
jgi:cell division protein FtsB